MYRAYRSRGKTLITLVVTLRASYELAAVAIFTIAAYRASFTARAPARCPGRPPIVPWRGRRAMRCTAPPRAGARAPAVRPLTRCVYANKPPDRDAHRTPLPAAPHSHPPPGAVCGALLPPQPRREHDTERAGPQEPRMHLLRHRRTFRLPLRPHERRSPILRHILP